MSSGAEFIPLRSLASPLCRFPWRRNNCFDAVRELFQVQQGYAGTNLGVGGHRGREANMIQSVIDGQAHAVVDLKRLF